MKETTEVIKDDGYCEGCYSHKEYNCVLKHYEKECPCNSCLVKMVCDSICSEVLLLCNRLNKELGVQ